MSAADNTDFNTTGNSVWNQQFMDHLTENFFPTVDPGPLPDESVKFLDDYPAWIAASKLNSFTGLEKFPYRFVSLGTTQAIDWWHYYVMSTGQRLRMFRGEYPYTRDALLEGGWTHDRFIGDRPLARGDAVIISMPFSGSGRKHEQWDKLMSTCNELKIPVFVDCAWFGTCHDITVDLSEPCIQMVAFSTTKGLSCGNWRSGIAFSRLNEGSLSVQTEWKHGIHLNVAIARSLMSAFGPDTIAKKYLDSHTAVCKHYGLETTNTVHIAQAPLTAEWERFSRDGVYNRVNIAKAIKLHKSKGRFTE